MWSETHAYTQGSERASRQASKQARCEEDLYVVGEAGGAGEGEEAGGDDDMQAAVGRVVVVEVLLCPEFIA